MGVIFNLGASQVLADTFTFPGDSLTTTDLNAWGGVKTLQYNAYFDFSAGPSTITVYGLNLTDIWYEGEWPWPPLTESQGAQARFGIKANGFWSRHQVHSAIGNGGGSWDQQSADWDHDDGFRKYLIQNQWSGTTSAVTVGNHQYNVEAYIPRTGAGPSVNDPAQVTDRAYNTFDMKITYTPTSTPGEYDVQGWVRLHKAASTEEMAIRPGDPEWGSPYTWVWNKAINNQANSEDAWIPFFDGSWTITGDYTSARPYLEIINWGVAQTRNHTFSWDSMVVEGTPVIPDEVWVDDDWTGNSNGDIVDGHIFGYDAFATIQDGIDAVSGSTVHVAAGTYNETVTVNKSVSLLGSPGAILDGAGLGGNGFLIKAADVSIDGFEIKNFVIGVRTYGGPGNFGDLDILNCDIHNNTQNGMLIVYDTFDTVTVEDCEISSNGQNGIGVANNTTITNLNIKDSAVSGNGHHGLFFAQAKISAILIQDSGFDGAATNGFSGIAFTTTASNIDSFTMQGGSLSGNKGTGLSVVQKASTFETISLDDVTIQNNRESGVTLGGGASTGSLSVLNSTFQGNGWEEFDLSGGWFGAFTVSGDTTFSGNTFGGGPWAAIYIGDKASFGSAPIIFNNDLSGYGNAIFNESSTVVNASGNWWGNNTPAGVASKVTAAKVDYTPWLDSGSDTGDPGFQGDFSTLHVDDDSQQVGATGRIQEAINLVTGSTVNVAAGMYNERVTINKSVDLRGAQYGVDPTASGARTNPANESIITESGLSTPNPDILIEIPNGVTNVKIDGFTLEGDPTNTTADTSVVRCWDDTIAIGNNIISGIYGVLYKGNDTLNVYQNVFMINKVGVTVQPNAATDVTISDNAFSLGSSPAGGESAMYMTSCSQCSVTGNTATGFVNGRAAGGSNLHHLTVSGNTFTGNKDAISIWGSSTFITVNDNDLSNSLRYGINIKGQDVTIEYNEIANNGDVGINIDRHVLNTERIEISRNNIYGNTNFGVEVDTANVSEIVNATCNWWGAEDGPSGAGSGSGDAVSGNVKFIPWLLGPAPDGECGGYPKGDLIVLKTVEWNGFPPDQAQTFEICISGPTFQTGTEQEVCQQIGANGGSLTWEDLTIGEYTVTETDPGALWTVNIAGSPVTVKADSAVQVDVTNTHAQYTKLKLTSMCSDDPDVTRRWRVRNTNPYDVEFTYQVVGTSQSGAYTAPANSDFFFETDTVGGPNTTKILVNAVQQDVKASGGAYCTGDLEVSKTVDWNGFPADGAQTFEICISGPMYPDGDCKTVGSNGGSLTWDDLWVGEYHVSETDPGDLWSTEIAGSPASVTEAGAQVSVLNTHETYTKLKLTSVCSDDPDVSRRWRVRNANSYDVAFTYIVYGTSQSGSLLAPADSDFYFETDTVSGANTTKILVNGVQQDVKASSGEACSENISIEKSQDLEFDRGSDSFTETPFVHHGDEIMYSIEVTNTFGQAVDVLVSDAMSAYVDYLADSLTIYKNGSEFYDPDKEDSISYDDTLDIFSLAYAFDALGADETLKLEFTVMVENSVLLGELIENFAVVFVTIPGLTFEVESNTVRVEVVPEPATFFLIGIGLFGIAALAHRKRKHQK